MAATRTAEIINLGVASPKWSYAKPMTFPRIHPNMVLLADGTVLTVGGARKHISTEPVRNAELFNPATGEWSVMAAQAADRAYHSTALLLPDGRVMSAGSERSNLPTTAEYYSPPYLFRGPRPTIIDAPASISYGQSFSVTTLDAPDIARVALVRLGSTTHATSFDQRYVDLRFTRATGELQVSSPASGNLAPPGPYMLFVLNTEGVPAVAEIVQVGASQL
jgi:hypothetical protein